MIFKQEIIKFLFILDILIMDLIINLIISFFKSYIINIIHFIIL